MLSHEQGDVASNAASSARYQNDFTFDHCSHFSLRLVGRRTAVARSRLLNATGADASRPPSILMNDVLICKH
ncbi:hypothetical protein EMIT0194P_180017 [Pseudomonas serbica]